MAKAKTKARVDRDEDDDIDTPGVDKPRSDAYVGLLAITLVAILGGAILMFLDQTEIADAAKGLQPPTVSVAPEGLESAAPAQN
jgi:hypothetical protein